MNFSNIQSVLSDEERRLLARADELQSRAAGGTSAFSGFLSPREIYILTAFGHETKVKRSELTGEDQISFFWGGYPDAERKIFISIPGFSAYSLPDSDAETYSPAELSTLVDDLDRHITSIFIKPSGYVGLSHRDYMGALLGLGIERDHVGDIVLVDSDAVVGAVVFAELKIADFIRSTLVEVGRDKVKICEVPENITLSRSFEPISGTVASARLDSVVSELVKTSRETAKELIRRGFVEHNYFEAADADVPVTSGDVISVRRDGRVRGGKFIIDRADELTGKGRVRVIARKYS